MHGGHIKMVDGALKKQKIFFYKFKNIKNFGLTKNKIKGQKWVTLGDRLPT